MEKVEFHKALERAGLDVKSLVKFSYSAPLVFFLAVILSGAIVALGEAALRGYHLMQPHTYWGHYYSIEPVQKEFGFDQTIRLTSVYELHRETDLSWSHTLYCKPFPGGQFEYFDSLIGSSFGSPPAIKTAEISRWRGQQPKITTECYIDSVISYADPLTKADRRQRIDGAGNTFKVNARK